MMRSIKTQAWISIAVILLVFAFAYGQVILSARMLEESRARRERAEDMNLIARSLEIAFWKTRFWEKALLDDRTAEAQSGFAASYQDFQTQVRFLTDKADLGESETEIKAIRDLLAVYETVFTEITRLHAELVVTRSHISTAMQALLAINHDVALRPLLDVLQFQEEHYHAPDRVPATGAQPDATAPKRRLELDTAPGPLSDLAQAYLDGHDAERRIRLRLEEQNALFAGIASDVVRMLSALFTRYDAVQAQEDAQEESLLQVITLLAMSTGALGACALLFSLRQLVARVVRPVSQLSQVVADVRRGDMTSRFASDHDDEVSRLGFAVNGMLDDLARQNRNLLAVQANLEQKLAELEASQNDLENATLELRLMSKVLDSSLNGIVITNASGVITQVNNAFTRITGYSAEEALGLTPRLLKSERHDQAFYEDMWTQLTTKGQWAGEIWNRRKSGEAYPEWLSISSIRDRQGGILNYVAVFHDITEIKMQEEIIRRQAYHDFLTGLPNRMLLMDRLDVAINHATRNNERIALIFLDLDDFKTINDSMGHIAGDLLLKEAASRLLSICRAEDTVSRLGGDEFVIMCVGDYADTDGVRLAERILSAFEAPFRVREAELFVGASLGLTFYPDDAQDSETLIKNADIAMYRAKELGKNKIQIFMPAMNDQATRRLAIENGVRHGLEHDEFYLAYQPKIRLSDMRLMGVEALVRWKTADGRIISPAEFIPVCEQSGLILPLGRLILEKAFADARRLPPQASAGSLMAVNLSGRQVLHASLARDVKAALWEAGVSPDLIEMEVTETAIMRDLDAASRTLTELADLGIKITLDDFGTGYSSLNYLRRFPITGLKVDMSFMAGIPGDASNEHMLEAVVAMSARLGVSVVAEGVETAEQAAFLRNIGCDMGQGYFFSRPVPMPELMDYVQAKGRDKRAALERLSTPQKRTKAPLAAGM